VLYYFGGQHIDSGSPKALIGLIDLLDRRRVAPMFLTSDDGPLISALESRGVDIVRGKRPESIDPRQPFATLGRIAAFWRLLGKHRVDVVHINELGWNYDFVFAAWLRRVPVILHVHLPDTIYPKNLHRLVAKRVLLVSEAQKQAITNFDFIRDKTDVMYNAVDLERIAKGTSIREELGVSKDDIVVGSLAQLRKGKGIDVLLDAARELIARHPRLVFLVAGRLGHGEEDFGREMMALAEAAEFQGRFRFLGSRDDVPNLLASFDVFVLPTLAETFGIAVVEAMAAGVPVVATRIGPIEEIVPSGDLGYLFDQVDVPSLVGAIEHVLALPDRGRAMGRRGQESLQGRFDAASLSATMHGIYDRICAS
jgi:glycosyltransferase involved in cell wall biosynthesis